MAGEGKRFVWGINPVLESLRVHPNRIEHLYLVEGQLGRRAAVEILSRARQVGVRVHRVSRERIAWLSKGGVHQGVLAELKAFEYVEIADLLNAAQASGRPPLVVLLDGVQDPQNLGAILRSAHALGAHGVVLPKDRACPITGAVAKASAGAVEHLKVARVVNLSRAIEELKEAGLWIAGADMRGERALYEVDLTGPVGLVVGGEGTGVRRGVLDKCDFRLRIPMLGKVASLNASVAAAIFLYEAARQRANVSRSSGVPS